MKRTLLAAAAIALSLCSPALAVEEVDVDAPELRPIPTVAIQNLPRQYKFVVMVSAMVMTPDNTFVYRKQVYVYDPTQQKFIRDFYVEQKINNE